MTNLLLDPNPIKIKNLTKICNWKIFSKRIKNKIYSQLKFSQKKLLTKIWERKQKEKRKKNIERKYVQKT